MQKHENKKKTETTATTNDINWQISERITVLIYRHFDQAVLSEQLTEVIEEAYDDRQSHQSSVEATVAHQVKCMKEKGNGPKLSKCRKNEDRKI